MGDLEKPKGRLGRRGLGTVIPLVYKIRLAPDLDRFTFEGFDEIDIHIRKPTTRVVLDCAGLDIRTVGLVQDGVSRTPVNATLDATSETLTIDLEEPLACGPAALSVDFAGRLGDEMRGFYRSAYESDGTRRYMALTQFEPTDARRAFPCWDDPGAKARLEITLVVPPDRIAISNTPEIGTIVNDRGFKEVRFAPTPPMSTYLLAWIVGEFDSIEEVTNEGVLVRVFTPVGKKERGRFALEVATRVLSFYHDYFGVPYPLPKLDLISIPDFAAGAMENWGAITYRETAILVDPRDSSTATRQRVAQVVAHELAHQWFGNLVTMEWWSDLWLNEGFASWMQYVAVDHLFPDWNVWTQFLVADFFRALKTDCLEHTHPIEVEVSDPAEINEIFDAISYSKGASLIRMLASFLGEEVFRRGLQLYLSRHRFGNASTADLWNALAEASGLPVERFMRTWTTQPGYPVIALRETERQGTSLLELQQSRFRMNALEGRDRDGGTAPDETLWWVPVGVAAEGHHMPSYLLMEDRRAVVALPGRDPGWVKINTGQNGFFRVNYDPSLLQRLVPAIETLGLPIPDRIGIENDAFALARAGLLPTTHVLALVSAYKNETEYAVWADLCANLDELRGISSAEGSSVDTEAFDRYLCELYRPVASRLGWEPSPVEPPLEALLRTLVLNALGHAGDTVTIEEALKRFRHVTNERGYLHPDLRIPVYTISVANGGTDAFEAVLRMYLAAELNEEKVRCLRALGCARRPSLLQRTLELSLSAAVRFQDSIFPIAEVARNPRGGDMAWRFLTDNWAEFERRSGGGGFLLARLIAVTTEQFASEQKAAEVEAFFESHSAPAARRTIRQSVERIRSNAAWMEREGRAITEWLRRYSVLVDARGQ